MLKKAIGYTVGFAILLCAVVATSVQYKWLDAPFAGAPDPKDIHRILGVEDSTVAAWSANYTSSGDLLNIGNTETRTLVNAAGPTIVQSHLRANDGNKLQAFQYNGTNQYHSLAHAAWMNVFDGDHTITMVVKSNAASNLMSHTTGGLTEGFRVTSSYTCSYYKAGPASVTVTGPTDTRADGYYHVIHIVVRSSIATFYIDNVAGTPINVSGYGVDGSAVFFLGASSSYFNGDILYTRINSAALTDAQIAKEVSLWQGIGVGSTWFASPSYARSGTAYQTYSDLSMALRPANTPRLGRDGGILIEESRENKILYSNDLSNAAWTKLDGAADTISANGATDDTGSAVMDGVIGFTNNVAHGVTQAVTMTAASWAFRFKSKAGDKGWAYFADNTVANATGYVNLATGALGTIGAGFSNVTAELRANSTVLVKGTVTGTAAAHTWQFGPAHADTDNDFIGDGLTVNAWFSGFQVELGSFATSQIDTTSAAATRSADDLKILPYRLRNTLHDVITTTPTMYLDFTQDPSGATITSSDGAYTLTKAGQPKHYRDSILGDYHLFNGSTDFWSISNGAGGSDFNFSQNFSIVAVVVPLNTSAGTRDICSKFSTEGYELYQSGTTIGAYFHNPTSNSNHTVSSCLQSGKPTLVTLSMTKVSGVSAADNQLRLYVDDFAVTSSNTAAFPDTNLGSLLLGNLSVSFFAGGLQYVAIYKGTVLTQANHNAMYAALKLAGVLPTTMSSTTHYTKIRVSFKAKALFSSTSDIGGVDRDMLSIGGTIGVASTTKNLISIKSGSDGKLYANFFDSVGSTARQLYTSSAQTDWNRWTEYIYSLDLTDLSLSTFKKDGVSVDGSNNMTGAYGISFVDSTINVAKSVSDVFGNYELKDLKISYY